MTDAKSLSSFPPLEKSAAGQANTEPCEVRILKSASEIDEVRDLWLSWKIHPNADYELFRFIMETRAEVKQPSIAAVLRQGTVESLLLARTVEARSPIKLGYFTLWRAKIRVVEVLHEGFIGTVSEDGAAAALKALMGQLEDSKADRLDLTHQREDSPLMRAVRELRGWFAHDFVPFTAAHRAMTLPDAPGEFLRRMKSKHRSWIKGKTRDLEAKFPGAVRYAMYSSPEDVAKAMADVEIVAAKTYQRGLGSGFRNDGEHIGLIMMGAKTGLTRVCILYCADVPRAFWIGCVYGDTFHSGFTGYDPSLREFEVGTLIMVNLIDRLCEEKVKAFDFGLGDAFYKQRFADLCWNEVSMSIYRPSFRGAVLKLAFTANHYLAKFLRSVLERLKLMDWVKRTWRGKMAKTQSAGT